MRRRTRRTRRWHRERFDNRWGDLATYNGEVMRGLVHTPEKDAEMAEKQARYNAIIRDNGDLWADADD